MIGSVAVVVLLSFAQPAPARVRTVALLPVRGAHAEVVALGPATPLPDRQALDGRWGPTHAPAGADPLLATLLAPEIARGGRLVRPAEWVVPRALPAVPHRI